MITQIRIPIVRDVQCGIYLRWWFNGWHYWLFTNNYEVVMQTEAMDVMTTQVYSIISKIERPTKLKATYGYSIAIEAMTAAQLAGFAGLLLAEMVEQYEDAAWREVDVTRKSHTVREEDAPAYGLVFEVTRKELPNVPAVYQQTQQLYISDTLCDLDDREIIALNKQVNDIAEMQDRQCDFTQQFKIRKTRAMRTLFELSGEVGASTNFPYTVQAAKLVIDGIEIISNGRLVLRKSDEQYYYVAIYSGNKNFFTTIDGLRLIDLALTGANHDWTAYWAAQSNLNGYVWLYPMLEPSNDGGMIPLTDDGNRAEVYAGWIWPHVQCKYIWDEIFAAAGFTVESPLPMLDILEKLYMPISTVVLSNFNTTPYLYNVFAFNSRIMNASEQNLCWSAGCQATVRSYVGDGLWRYTSQYVVKVAGDYKIRATFSSPDNTSMPVHVYVYSGAVLLGELTGGNFKTSIYRGHLLWTRYYEGTFALLVDWGITIRVTYCVGVTQYSVQILSIDAPHISYGSSVQVNRHLPDLTQTDFIKMICNLLGYVPDTNARDKKIRFWNYQALYDNFAQARDWSAYLSERDDEAEFRFGDYAQRNYLRYTEADDVKLDAGSGMIQVDDGALAKDKEVVKLPVSTTDEVVVTGDVVVSRIDFNKWNDTTSAYDQNDSIKPRLVYVDRVPEDLTVSPVYQKTFSFRALVAGGTTYDVVTPLKASSNEIHFSSLTESYTGLARMLAKSALRRARFNLPAYEVAGFKHDIPVYLSQYKAFFYVNKIENYVNGRLCTVELIKL